jgi:hypothetical protein
MRRVPMALAAGVLLIVVALGLVLSRAPLTVAATNGISAATKVASTAGDATTCQSAGTLPAGTSAIRVSLSANIGPKVTIRVSAGGRTIAAGSRPAGWGLAETVTVGVKPLPHAVAGVRLCTIIGAAVESFEIRGQIINKGLYLRVEYLRPGKTSWLSLAPSIAEHMGLGRSPTGAWIAWLALIAMLAVVALTSRLVLQEIR